MTKPHYFDEPEQAKDDSLLTLVKGQGYVPMTCLLSGQVVTGLVNQGKDPCQGCECDRLVCHGRPKHRETDPEREFERWYRECRHRDINFDY